MGDDEKVVLLTLQFEDYRFETNSNIVVRLLILANCSGYWIRKHILRLLGSDDDKDLLHASPPPQGIPSLIVFQTSFHKFLDSVDSFESVVGLCTLENSASRLSRQFGVESKSRLSVALAAYLPLLFLSRLIVLLRDALVGSGSFSWHSPLLVATNEHPLCKNPLLELFPPEGC